MEINITSSRYFRLVLFENELDSFKQVFAKSGDALKSCLSAILFDNLS